MYKIRTEVLVYQGFMKRRMMTAVHVRMLSGESGVHTNARSKMTNYSEYKHKKVEW